MTDVATIQQTLLDSLRRRQTQDVPYRHWLLEGCLPEEDGDAIAALPFPIAEIEDTGGKRETHNASRNFFSVENRERYPVVENVSQAFQSSKVVHALEETFGVELAGNYLRIEHCQDSGGFWLEPHTDIGAKKFTMLVGYTKAPGAEDWGTSIYYDKDRFYGNAPFGFNKGLVFIPSDHSWHGFESRPIDGIRISIIVNYVIPEWRSRHELAFPDQPVLS